MKQEDFEKAYDINYETEKLNKNIDTIKEVIGELENDFLFKDCLFNVQTKDAKYTSFYLKLTKEIADSIISHLKLRKQEIETKIRKLEKEFESL